MWLYNDPAWRSEQPKVHQQVKDAGFESVMLEVLATQTLQNYKAMLDGVGLKPAPGYVNVTIPPDGGRGLTHGSAEWVHLFDGIRRRAEETNYMGLDSVFLAAPLHYEGNRRTTEQTAVGAFFDQSLLDLIVELLTEAGEVLKARASAPACTTTSAARSRPRRRSSTSWATSTPRSSGRPSTWATWPGPALTTARCCGGTPIAWSTSTSRTST